MADRQTGQVDEVLSRLVGRHKRELDRQGEAVDLVLDIVAEEVDWLKKPGSKAVVGAEE